MQPQRAMIDQRSSLSGDGGIGQLLRDGTRNEHLFEYPGKEFRAIDEA